MAKQKRENGSGTFTVKPNGMIEFRVMHEGQRKSFSGKNETECKRKYREWAKETAQNEVKQKQALSNITVLEYIQRWAKVFKFGKIKDSTYDRLENTIKHQIAPYNIANMKLSSLTDEIVQNFIDEQSLLYSRSTVKKIYEVFNPTLRRAFSEGLILSNVMDNVSVPNEEFFVTHPKKQIEIYTDKEIEILTKAVYEYYFINSRRYRYAPAFILILNTGIRFGEMLALKWNCVNFEKKTIFIAETSSYVQNRNRFNSSNRKVSVTTTTKNRQTRYVPLNETALKALKELKQRQESQNIISEYVISNLDGKMLQGRSVQDVFENICDEIGIGHKGIHALRHTFASKLIRKKVDIGIISELLGHSSVKITYDTYIHFIKEQKIEAIKAIEI